MIVFHAQVDSLVLSKNMVLILYRIMLGSHVLSLYPIAFRISTTKYNLVCNNNSDTFYLKKHNVKHALLNSQLEAICNSLMQAKTFAWYGTLNCISKNYILRSRVTFTQSAGAVEYTDCIFAEG